MRSERKSSFETIFGGSIHLAPLGAAGIGIRHSCLLGTFIVNASVLLSGDHSSAAGVSVTWVICEAAPSASIQRTQICDPLGSPFATYAMRLPSGDQRTSAPCTSVRLCVPSVFMIHRLVSHLSFILSIWRSP